ncbi:MAG: hypothetical protein H6702_12705 [Myxococcales bacterium]|nr:hypothetical protein [Myxococcales bacterium]
MPARTLKPALSALLALTALTACEGLSVRPGTVFADDDREGTVAFDERLPLTFATAVRTCMLTADQPVVRFEAGDRPALFDQCTPDTSGDIAAFTDADLERFREALAATPMSSKERTTVAIATPVLVAQAQAGEVPPLPDVGFRDGVLQERVRVADERVWFGGWHTVGYWYCDVGYQVTVDFTGVNLADFSLGWHADPDAPTAPVEVALDFVDNTDVVTGRGAAQLNRCGFRVTNAWLVDWLDLSFSFALPLRAAVAFDIDVEHLRVVGRGTPRVVDGQAELAWTVSATAHGVRAHDTALPYVATLDTLLRLLPRVGVDAVGLAEALVARQMRPLFEEQLGPQLELLLNTATAKESRLVQPLRHPKLSGPAFSYTR